jgi:hypothetical protein
MGAGHSNSQPTFDADHPFCLSGGTTGAETLWCRGSSVPDALGTASAGLLMCHPSVDPAKPSTGAYSCPSTLTFSALIQQDLTKGTGLAQPLPLAPVLSAATTYFQVGGPTPATDLVHIYPMKTGQTCPGDNRGQTLTYGDLEFCTAPPVTTPVPPGPK